MNKEQIIADMAEAIDRCDHEVPAVAFTSLDAEAEFHRTRRARAAYNASPLAHVGELVEALEDISTFADRAYATPHDFTARCGDRAKQALSRFKDWKANPAPVSVDGWQPIESAPKDGSLIKCKGNEGRDYYARWAWSPNAGVNSWCGEVMGIILPITPPPEYWRPLPKPPQTEGNKS